jgi:hypothetical protein
MMTAKEWLEKNGSFNEGVEILRQLGGNMAVFLPLSQQSYISQADKHRLREAIQSLAAQLPPSHNAKQEPAAEPEIIQQYREKGRLMMKLQADTHTRLKVSESDQERYVLAEDLMERIIPQLDKVYDALRAWESDSILPVAIEVDSIREAGKKLNKWKTIKDRVIRLKRYLKTGKNEQGDLTDEMRLAYEKEILEKTLEYDALCIELGKKNKLDDGGQTE